MNGPDERSGFLVGTERLFPGSCCGNQVFTVRTTNNGDEHGRCFKIVRDLGKPLGDRVVCRKQRGNVRLHSEAGDERRGKEKEEGREDEDGFSFSYNPCAGFFKTLCQLHMYSLCTAIKIVENFFSVDSKFYING